MKSVLKISFLLLLPFFARAQSPLSELDRLRQEVQLAKNDTSRMYAFDNLGSYYDDVNLDSSVYYLEKAIAIARQLEFRIDEAGFYGDISWPLDKLGNYPQSLKSLNMAWLIVNNPVNEKYIYKLPKGQTPQSFRLKTLDWVHWCFVGLYRYTGNYEKAIIAANESKRIAETSKDSFGLTYVNSELGYAYLKLNKLDSALYFDQLALVYNAATSTNTKFQGYLYIQIGEAYMQKGDTTLARQSFEKGIQVSALANNQIKNGEAHIALARLFQSQNKFDSSLYQSQMALSILEFAGKEKSTAIAYRMISDCYASLGMQDSSFVYLKMATVLNDKLEKAEKEKIQEFQVAGFEAALRSQELEKEKIQTQGKIRIYGMLAGLSILSVIGFILYRNNRQKQKANSVLEATLSNLKSTQAQLIQSEKMASLGELTAGIAHEIQNPLNFVNNFSEVNKELLIEMNDELDKGNLVEAKSIAADVIENQEKINHHGKRADAIVRGMLQHSRNSSGQKELTDINGLADEYLRLSYHGFRAKDKSFNATLITEFDETICNINIIPQDIGRALLNLITNAFYAVDEKKKQLGEGYEPIVSIRTKKGNDKITIAVKDNGNGIPQKVINKIFQPFFTTKPTGEGTGLGLSLAYDIVKSHGGEIKVETEQGGGSEFIVQLPTFKQTS